LLLFLMMAEDRLVYFPSTPGIPVLKDLNGQPLVTSVSIPTEDGQMLEGWYFDHDASATQTVGSSTNASHGKEKSGEKNGNPHSNRPVVLFFHGNAGHIGHRFPIGHQWRKALNADVLMVDYRGYGNSTGRPSEKGLYKDSWGAYFWLVNEKKIAPQRIIIVGESLGGGVAIELASRSKTGEVKAGALVLLNTFLSLPEVAKSTYPWVPTKAIMRNQYPSHDRIADCLLPIFIYHGLEDTLVSPKHSQRLHEKANEPKQLFLAPQKGHNDAWDDSAFRAVKQFLHPFIDRTLAAE
jgi:hypothetical protein